MHWAAFRAEYPAVSSQALHLHPFQEGPYCVCYTSADQGFERCKNLPQIQAQEEGKVCGLRLGESGEMHR